MTTRPTVSAVVATRDRIELLRRAIQSMVDQAPSSPDQIIVVFDQSEPDESLLVEFSDHNLILIPNSRTPGLPGARNSGIDAASGDWIAFCDDDDRWTPNHLDELLKVADESIDFVVSGISIEHTDRTIERLPGHDELDLDLLLRSRVMAAHSSTFMIRRAAILGELGFDDEDLPGGGYGEDYDWMLRAARIRPIRAVNQPLAIIAWNSNSFYRNRWRAMIDGTAAIIEKTPEFSRSRKGLARLKGHMAFAHAGLGERRQAWTLVRETFVLNPLQLRTYVTAAVLLRMVSANWLVRTANSFGYGI